MQFNYFETRFEIYKIKEAAHNFFKCLQEYQEQALKELVIDKNTKKIIAVEELNDFVFKIILDNFKRNLTHTIYLEDYIYMEKKVGKKRIDYFVMAYFEHMLIREYYFRNTGKRINVRDNVFETKCICLIGLKTKYYADSNGKQSY